MTRSGYDEDYDGYGDTNLWQGAVLSATRGARGQRFLKELASALDALPEKRLIANELDANGEVCAIGAVGRARGIDMRRINPGNHKMVGKVFDIAPALVSEITYTNDNEGCDDTPEERYQRMCRFAKSSIWTWDTDGATS